MAESRHQTFRELGSEVRLRKTKLSGLITGPRNVSVYLIWGYGGLLQDQLGDEAIRDKWHLIGL